MTRGEVAVSLCDYAKEFILKYKNHKLDQKVIDAIIVDFINYFGVVQLNMDLAMYTKDLRDEKKLSTPETALDKKIIVDSLNFRKVEYDKLGIIRSVNRNSHMNECAGKAKADNSEAIKLIDEFINCYMDA